eukprot:m.6302 g.6302  ORF g.6302 m.6302 type:complete len:411 (+) comp4746_c0_seq1:235-1467(+)
MADLTVGEGISPPSPPPLSAALEEAQLEENQNAQENLELRQHITLLGGLWLAIVAALLWWEVGLFVSTEISSPATNILYLRESIHLSKTFLEDFSPFPCGLVSLGLGLLLGDAGQVFFVFSLFAALGSVFLLTQISTLNNKEKLSSACWYLFNPLTLLSGCTRSTCFVRDFLLSLALSKALNNTPRSLLAMLSLSLLALEDPYMLLLLPCFLSLLNLNRRQRALSLLLFFLLFTGAFLFPHRLTAAWHARFTAEFSSTEPAVGILWYLFAETFPQFQPFHTATAFLSLVCSVAVAQIVIGNPRVRLWIVLGLLSLWRPWATWSDWQILLGLWPPIQSNITTLKYFFVTFPLLLATSALQPILRDVWLGRGSANANYYFAAALVRTASATALLVDVANRAHEQSTSLVNRT